MLFRPSSGDASGGPAEESLRDKLRLDRRQTPSALGPQGVPSGAGFLIPALGDEELFSLSDGLRWLWPSHP